MLCFKFCFDTKDRYAVLVDNIFFPKSKKTSTQENIDKLMFYVISSPEKLDRITVRLHSHLSEFLKYQKQDSALLVFDVTNQLLDSSRSTFINLMMDEYFKMIVQLLEYDNMTLQLQAAKSFRKFSEINLDIPKISDYIKPLVSQFVRLATCNTLIPENNKTLHMLGLAGIQGLIIKTKNLASHNIWSPEYASEIVGALIENFKPIGDPNTMIPLSDETISYFNEFNKSSEQEHLQAGVSSEHLQPLLNPFSSSAILVSIYNLRELLLLSTISNANAIISPIYEYWCKNKLWREIEPTRRILELISHSLKPQLEHIAIRSIFEVIRKYIEDQQVVDIISALPAFSGKHSGSTLGKKNCIKGHVYTEIINLLVALLKESCSLYKSDVDYLNPSTNVLLILIKKLPNFQKSEAYQMIINQIPYSKDKKSSGESNLGSITMTLTQQAEVILLMNTMEKVTILYRDSKTAVVLNLIFLEQLVRCIRLPLEVSRMSVMKTLINLVDQSSIYQTIIKYMSELSVKQILRSDLELKDISVKRVIHIIEILATTLFQTQSSLELIRDFTAFVLIICFEINLPKLHEALCIRLITIKVDLTIPYLHDMYQAMVLAIFQFISLIMTHAKLIDICNSVKSARLSIGPTFWFPSTLIDAPMQEIAHKLDTDVYFDPKQIEIAFDLHDMLLTQQEIDSPKYSFINIDSSEHDSISIGSSTSERRSKITDHKKDISIIGNIGFIRRDQNCTKDVSSEEIENKYMKTSACYNQCSDTPRIGQRKGDDEYIN